VKDGAEAYVPSEEPAHDPHGLPFQAALAFERGLVVGHRFYEALMPITYPFTSEKAPANGGEWGTWRTSAHLSRGPVVPVLQMIGIPEMDLVQPSPAQIRAQIASSIVHGATGAFYYTLISDKPSSEGRKGFFAADDKPAWNAFATMHALEDDLVPVLFADGSEEVERGSAKTIEWRTWKSADDHAAASRVTLIVNPTARARTVSIAKIVRQEEGEQLRSWSDCSPIDTGEELTLEPYGLIVVETVR